MHLTVTAPWLRPDLEKAVVREAAVPRVRAEQLTVAIATCNSNATCKANANSNAIGERTNKSE